jgi:hypothetical protein
MDQGHIFQKGYIMAIGVATVIGADSAAGITPPELGHHSAQLPIVNCPNCAVAPNSLRANIDDKETRYSIHRLR